MSGITISSQPFNEKNPWGKGSTVITQDNLAFSRVRREAIAAVKDRRATADQQVLVADADRVVAETMAARDK